MDDKTLQVIEESGLYNFGFDIIEGRRKNMLKCSCGGAIKVRKIFDLMKTYVVALDGALLFDSREEQDITEVFAECTVCYKTFEMINDNSVVVPLKEKVK